jgi:hypothetical protein
MVSDFIERVRAVLRRDGVTPGGLARKAGLHKNTLYGADRDGWNPTLAVLRALEPVVAEIEGEAAVVHEPVPSGEWPIPSPGKSSDLTDRAEAARQVA